VIEYEKIIKKLKSLSNPKAIIVTAKYEIFPKNTYRVSIPNPRKIVKEMGISHKFSQKY